MSKLAQDKKNQRYQYRKFMYPLCSYVYRMPNYTGLKAVGANSVEYNQIQVNVINTVITGIYTSDVIITGNEDYGWYKTFKLSEGLLQILWG